MKASEVIMELKTLIDQYGDLDVVTSDDDEGGLEYNDDDDVAVFIFGR